MKERIIEILKNRTFGVSTEPQNLRLLAADLNAAFEEKIREELIAYDKFLSSTYWGISHVIKHDEAVDTYLKSREK